MHISGIDLCGPADHFLSFIIQLVLGGLLSITLACEYLSLLLYNVCHIWMRMYSLFRTTDFRALGSQPCNFCHCNTCLHTRFCTQLRSCITLFGFYPTDIDLVHNASKGPPAWGCYAVRPFVRPLACTAFTDNNSFERSEVSPYSPLWYQSRTLTNRNTSSQHFGTRLLCRVWRACIGAVFHRNSTKVRII